MAWCMYHMPLLVLDSYISCDIINSLDHNSVNMLLDIIASGFPIPLDRWLNWSVWRLGEPRGMDVEVLGIMSTNLR